MKKIVLSLAILSSFALGATSAYAVKDPAGWQREGQKMIENPNDKSFDDMTNAKTNKEYKEYFDKRFEAMGKKNDDKISDEQVLFIDFVLADTDHTGSLDRDESKSIPILFDHFDAIDTNHNDRITGDEVYDFMENWRKFHEIKGLR
jgi:hypothetical protein